MMIEIANHWPQIQADYLGVHDLLARGFTLKDASNPANRQIIQSLQILISITRRMTRGQSDKMRDVRLSDDPPVTRETENFDAGRSHDDTHAFHPSNEFNESRLDE